jgi:apolipoprotein D and lipocalin family protein
VTNGRLPQPAGEGGRAAVCRRRLAALTVASVLTAPVLARTQTPVQTVSAVDLNRYAGTWFEVARLPNRFQQDCVASVRATYERRADGRLDVINRCEASGGRTIEARGVARLVDTRSSAKLKVRFAPAALSFLPFVWGDYWIIGLADDYGWAVVGSPDRQYLWVLARAPGLPADRLAAALAIARNNGFDISRLVYPSS